MRELARPSVVFFKPTLPGDEFIPAGGMINRRAQFDIDGVVTVRYWPIERWQLWR